MLKPLAVNSLLILLCSLTVGCQPGDSPSNKASQAQETLIPFDILDNGKMSGVAVEKTTLFEFNDHTAFKAFWDKHMPVNPSAAMPDVDFLHKTVIAVVDSDQPNGGYYLRFEKIEQVEHELWIYVTREQPETECMNMGMVAQPYVLIAIDKTQLKPKLVFKTNNYPC